MRFTTVFPDTEGCPEGMYGLEDVYEPEVFYDFSLFSSRAEYASDALNLPIAYFFDTDHGYFDLVYLMPRKMKGSVLRLANPDREQVLAWLDGWLPGEIATWFGWEEQP